MSPDYFAALPLRISSTQSWIDCVLSDMDGFLIDHAAAEKKASGMATNMISHYPDRKKLVMAMADLAIEELAHYKEVIKLIHSRGGQLGADTKDHYVIQFRQHMRNGRDEYFLDRLLIGSIIEARGAERFGLLARDLSCQQLKAFYTAIAESEQKHYTLFLDLAKLYFDDQQVQQRFDQLLDVEADIVQQLPILAKLH